MILNVKDILTIEGKEYTVVDMLNIDAKQYIYLINLDDSSDIKFCLLNDNKILEVLDKEEVKMLIKKFCENIS